MSGDDEYVRRLVDSMPPLTEDQRSRISRLLWPVDPERERHDEVAPVAQPRVSLYRHYDKDGVLLYVGISSGLPQRTAAHARMSSWSRFVADSKAEWFPNRALAEAAEKRAIREEEPLFNVLHNGQRGERLTQYLAERGAWDLLRPA